MDLKVKTGYDPETKMFALGIEMGGKITSQIIFPHGMESIIAEAVLTQARLIREDNGSKIIKPGITDLTKLGQGEKPC